MRKREPDERSLAVQARLAAFVMAGAMLVWMGLQWLGGRLEWDARFVFLFDFAALAAFFWALVITWRIWRHRRNN